MEPLPEFEIYYGRTGPMRVYGLSELIFTLSRCKMEQQVKMETCPIPDAPSKDLSFPTKVNTQVLAISLPMCQLILTSQSLSARPVLHRGYDEECMPQVQQ